MAEIKTKERLKELRGLSDADLAASAEASRRAIYEVRRSRLSKVQENVKETRAYRKDIARVLTIRRQRELQAQTSAK